VWHRDFEAWQGWKSSSSSGRKGTEVLNVWDRVFEAWQGFKSSSSGGRKKTQVSDV
jgi:hypothetical protein